MAPEGDGDELDLAELSRLSRVSPRTIRYYIQEGLLPSPGKRGRGARYDRGVLDRLELIKRLQRDKWPLGKIAEYFAGLEEEGGGRKEEGGSRGVPLPPSSLLLPQRSTWERVRVGPNVEISVRTPLQADQRIVVERLIESARRMLDSD